VNRIRVGIIGQGRSGRDIHAHSLATVVPQLFEIIVLPMGQVRRQIAVIEECHRQNPLLRRRTP
jgi:hypothetical protein